jgi:predicted permease
MWDLRFALRLIQRNWVFSLTVIAILALCAGANTAVLSVVNAALVAPLPYPEPRRLNQIVVYSNGGYNGDNVNGWTWEMVHDRAPSLESAVFRGSRGVNLGFNGAGVFIREQRVSAGFFHVLGIAPQIGREFTADEDRAGGPPAVILSDSLWRKFFNADPAMIGRAILLRGESYTVAGVMPAKFRSNAEADVWTPLRPSHTGEGGGFNYGIIARLKPGATTAEASSQLQALVPELKRLGAFSANANVRLGIESLQTARARPMRRPLMIVWAAVAAVFLLGCVNIGGMMLARAAGRSAEICTRLALGAPPSRIVRQLLVESIMLGSIGGMLGIFVGSLALDGLKSLGAPAFDILSSVEMDWRVMAAAILLALMASAGFGLAPAWRAAHLDLRTAQSGSRHIAGRREFVPLGGLVSGQVAVAIPLLIGAGLLLRTLLYLWTLSPGFDPNHVLTAEFSMTDARYDTPKTMRYYDAVIARLRQIPGVEQAAVALTLPYERGLNVGLKLPGDTRWRITDYAYVTPEYFAALRIPLLQGRVFTPADGAKTANVAIVNQAFVDLYFKTKPALGEPINVDQQQRQIIGVTASVQQARPGWGGDFAPNTHVATVYVPAAQIEDMRPIHAWLSPNWIVRSSLPPEQVKAAVERATRTADPLVPIAAFRSIEDLKSESLSFQKFLAILTNAIALLAILLTALGIYGLIANMAGERTRELGIRLALGASRAETVRAALRPALIWVAAGVAIGIAAAIALERFVGSFLWGVRLADPVTLIAVAVGFLAATALASFAPAARVARLNPVDTLRGD